MYDVVVMMAKNSGRLPRVINNFKPEVHVMDNFVVQTFVRKT